MLILRALLLWTVVSIHVVGAAFLFRRLFPRESRWLAFIVPEIVIVLLCNFVEHHLALTALRFLLPVTTIASVYLMGVSKHCWRVMRLPALLLLAAFAFTLTLRVLRPDIENARDGIPDLGLISSFTFGQTLPVESTWLPPVKLTSYYCLEHYGASVLIRLLGVDIGTGFNLSCALLSAYLYFLAGAMAWHLGRGKLWIAILAPALTACAMTGTAGYLWLTVRNMEPNNIIDPYSLLQHAYVTQHPENQQVDENPDVPGNWFLGHLTPVNSIDGGHPLIPPGFGAWTGYFHSANTGQLVICIALLSVIEMLRRKKANWPWICLGVSPFLMLTTSTWGLPMVVFVALAGLIAAVRMKVTPANTKVVAATSAGLVVLLLPMLSYFLDWALPTTVMFLTPDQHTQWPEFALQWWPIYLPWIALCFIWKRLAPVSRIVLIMTPLAFAGVEIWNFGWRSDMTSKSWGMIYAAAWTVFLPEIARQRAWPFRVVLGLIGIGCVLSLCFWVTYYDRVVVSAEVGHLDGQGQYRLDRRKARIVETLSRMNDQIIIPGKVALWYTPNPLLATFSHNRTYATGVNVSDSIFFTNGISEASRRSASVSLLYDGKLPNPLYFLRQENIAAVVIYPEDNIDPAVVDQLKQKLAPYYTYQDANFRTFQQLQGDASPDRPCAGVFIYRPEMTTLLGPVAHPENP